MQTPTPLPLSGCLVLILWLAAVSAYGQAKQAPAAGKKPSSPAAAAKKPAAKKPAGKAKASKSTRSKKTVPRPTAPSAERIRQIQKALAASGHYRQEPTGRLDAATAAALSSFQKANGLEPTGKLNAWTLRKLEQFGLPRTSRTGPALQAQIPSK
jgi:peptidoglycan hydrolase-like protein with peptidoglycan-binding domain